MSRAAAPQSVYDAIVVGGGAAGLSAALVLGRARRRTLVLDSGRPRNAPSPAAHGLFTRDGATPARLLAVARSQLRRYPSVEYRSEQVRIASRAMDQLMVQGADGTRYAARRLLLAFGVQDVLPPIDGLAERWGTGVLHCGYCHGWEVRDRPLALYATSEQAMDTAMTLVRWSRDLVLCTHGTAWPDARHRQLLAANGVRLIETELRRVEGAPPQLRLVFADGTIETCRAIFVSPTLAMEKAIPDALGCEYAGAARIAVGADWQTSAPGVYAAGDLAGPGGQVVTAAASGATAAMMLNADLAREEFAAAITLTGDCAPHPAYFSSGLQPSSARRRRAPA